jgi:hypothetical protein
METCFRRLAERRAPPIRPGPSSIITHSSGAKPVVVPLYLRSFIMTRQRCPAAGRPRATIAGGHHAGRVPIACLHALRMFPSCSP